MFYTKREPFAEWQKNIFYYKEELIMRKLLAIMMSVCLIVSGMTGLVFTAAAAGTSWDTAIEIGTADEFAAMAANNEGKYFKLTADIDLTKTTGGYTPSVFKGHLDGQNKTVNVAIATTSDYAGLFTKLGGLFTVKNLVITGSVSVQYNIGGGLAGGIDTATVTSGSVLKNITNKANITGRDKLGGIIGDMSGSWAITASELYNEGSITGAYYQPDCVGGIFGHMSKVSLTQAANHGSVTGYTNVGGIIGYSAQDNNISKCYNTASVTATGGDAGGIVGVTVNNPTFTNCYNIGTVTATNAGGIVGMANAWVTISHCYDMGNQSIVAANAAGNIGASNCYYVASSETDSISGTTAVTADGLKGVTLSDAYFVKENPQNWDYAYPQLTDNPHKVVEPEKGTKENPYALLNEADVIAIAEDPDAYYEVMGPIELTASYQPCAFSGHLQGNGYTITLAGKPLFTDLTGAFSVSSLVLAGTVTGTSNPVGALANQAPHGQVQAGAKLSDITNTASVSSTGGNVGGIIGLCQGYWNLTVDNLHNTGSVSGKNNVGGLFGNTNRVNISNSSNLGDVSTIAVADNDDHVGGITGAHVFGGTLENCYNSGTITGNVAGGLCAYVANGAVTFKNCYNAGNVNGLRYTGGLLGWASVTGNSLINCYNAGNVNGAVVNNPLAATTVYEEDDRVGYYTFTDCYYLSADEAHDDKFANTTPKNRENLKSVALGSAFSSSATYPFPQLTNNTQKKAYSVYKVTASAGDNGEMTPSGTVYVTNGSDFTAVVTTKEYYVTDTVKLNSVEQPSTVINEDGVLTLAISADSVVELTFKEMDAVAPTITSVNTPYLLANGSITFAKRTEGYKMTIIEHGVAYATSADAFTGWDGIESASVKKLNAKTNTLTFGIMLNGDKLIGTTYYTMPYVIYVDEAGVTHLITGDVVVNAL